MGRWMDRQTGVGGKAEQKPWARTCSRKHYVCLENPNQCSWSTRMLWIYPLGLAPAPIPGRTSPS